MMKTAKGRCGLERACIDSCLQAQTWFVLLSQYEAFSTPALSKNIKRFEQTIENKRPCCLPCLLQLTNISIFFNMKPNAWRAILMICLGGDTVIYDHHSKTHQHQNELQESALPQFVHFRNDSWNSLAMPFDLGIAWLLKKLNNSRQQRVLLCSEVISNVSCVTALYCIRN